MKEIKRMIVPHIILVALAVAAIVDDAKHPERWGDWWCNPTYSIPYCLALVSLIAVVLFRWWRMERRRPNELTLLNECNRLHAEGNFEAAEAAYQKWKRMYGKETLSRNGERALLGDAADEAGGGRKPAEVTLRVMPPGAEIVYLDDAAGEAGGGRKPAEVKLLVMPPGAEIVYLDDDGGDASPAEPSCNSQKGIGCVRGKSAE